MVSYMASQTVHQHSFSFCRKLSSFDYIKAVLSSMRDLDRFKKSSHSLPGAELHPGDQVPMYPPPQTEISRGRDAPPPVDKPCVEVEQTVPVLCPAWTGAFLLPESQSLRLGSVRAIRAQSQQGT